MWNESCPQNHNEATPCLPSHKAGNAHFKTSFVVPGVAEGLHYLKYLNDFWVLLGLRAVVVPFAIKETISSIWLSYFLFIFVPYTIIQRRHFVADHSPGTKPPCQNAKDKLGQEKQKAYIK